MTMTKKNNNECWVINGVIDNLIKQSRLMTSNEFSLYFAQTLILQNREIGKEVLEHFDLLNTNSIDKLYNKLKTI